MYSSRKLRCNYNFRHCRFEVLEAEKELYLESSRRSFQQALDLHRLDQVDVDERWLYHYMLAKVAEKKQEDPNVYLQHYVTVRILTISCNSHEKFNSFFLQIS